MNRLYFKFSDYLKERYQDKVYKLPVNIPCTCPNRDGTLSTKGCIFCGEEGAGFETLPSCLPVSEQLLKNMAYIKEHYKANQFIAYFQSYSSTYLEIQQFASYLDEAVLPGIVAFYISTRPDCVTDEHIKALKNVKKRGLDIVVELGLQSINENTLQFINRGHGVEVFTKTSKTLKQEGLEVCAHVINDFPTDTPDDVISCARYLTDLGVTQVKCHSLYVLEGTPLGELYQMGELKLLTLNEFIERTISFLEYLSPDIAIQRLIGRAPKERLLYGNFGMSWWKVQSLIEEKMILENRYQGKHSSKE